MLFVAKRLLQVLSVIIVLNQTFGYLLPKVAVPLHYDLNLEVELGPKFQYNGTVGISIKVLEATKSLFLHSNDLKLDESRIFVRDGSSIIKAKSVQFDTNLDILNITVPTTIVPGLYTLEVPFSGSYFTTTRGLFMDKYTRGDGKTRYLLATQFEPSHARDMFPCFDEPNLKATFSVRVNHPSDYNAVSNSEVENISKFGATTVTSFKKTPPMSTYLLALSVSEFVAFNNYTVAGTHTAIHIYVEPSRINDANFAHAISVESVYHLQNILGVNYSLPKLDGIAVRIFGGGMENWGLIVYGTSIISSGPNMSDSEKRGTTGLLCHEIAHQWFGNLVTLDWWDYVWLNEGFATFYADKCADKIYPKYRNMYNHIVDLQSILRGDSQISSTQQLNYPVTHPMYFMIKFGGISYSKGSAVIRMMSNTFPGFDKAITDYLKMHSMENTVPEDLFDSFEKFETGLPKGIRVHDVMDGWTNNAGFPLITMSVTINSTELATVVVSQKRFALDKDYDPDVKWWIPITVAYESNGNFEKLRPSIWLSNTEANTSFSVPNPSGWIIANLQQTVFCRVNYDTENWQKIIKYLNGRYFKEIHVLNRVQLVADIGAFGKIGLVDQSLVFDLLNYLKQEQDDLPHRTSKNTFRMYSDFLRGTDAYPKYQKFVENIYGKNNASELLREPNLETLVIDALDKMPYKNANSIPAFDDVAERITSEIQLKKVRMAAGASLRSVHPHKSEFVKTLESRAASNIYHKTEFLRKHYHEVDEWLNKNV